MISFFNDNELKFIIGLRVANSAFSNLYEKENKILYSSKIRPLKLSKLPISQIEIKFPNASRSDLYFAIHYGASTKINK